MIAGRALFVALGGTATAAVTVARDSVGSPQIRAGAVRASEIRDGGVTVADVSAGARTALRGQLRFARAEALATLPPCRDESLADCRDHLTLPLESSAGARTAPQSPATPAPAAVEPGRNWLVDAKLQVAVNNGGGFESITCGLVSGGAPLDRAELLGRPSESALEHITLTAVVRKPAGDPTVALRCTSDGTEVVVSHALITAQETGSVIRP